MVKYYDPVPLFGNFLLFLQWFLLMNHTFPRRFSKTVTSLGCLTLFAVHIWLGSTLPYMSLIRLFYGPFLFTAGFLILFRGRWQKIACVVAGLYTLVWFTEMLCTLFVYTPEILAGQMNAQPLFRQMLSYFFVIPMNATLIWILDILINRAKNRLSIKQWLLCAVFLIAQLFILFGYVRELCLDAQANQKAYALFVLMACVVMDIFLVQYVLSEAQRERLQKENQLLASQMDGQLRRYASITAEYEAVRRMRHDIAKHLTAMENLLRSGENGEAARYIAVLKEQSYSAAPQLCENPAVDALLNSYRERAKELGISRNLQVQVPADSGISNPDLVCAFGNLLDNAMEACPLGQDGCIRLRSALLRGCMVISIENPVGDRAKKPRQISELERGVGTRVLNHIAGKYRGTYETEQAGETFFARLTLIQGEKRNGPNSDL